jgi:hypothetical protein
MLVGSHREGGRPVAAALTNDLDIRAGYEQKGRAAVARFMEPRFVWQAPSPPIRVILPISTGASRDLDIRKERFARTSPKSNQTSRCCD